MFKKICFLLSILARTLFAQDIFGPDLKPEEREEVTEYLAIYQKLTNAQTISYNWLERIGLAKEMLRAVKLEHSNKTAAYIQKIIIPGAWGKSKSRPKPRTIIRKRTDYAWKEIALAIMDLDNGNIEIIKIKKVGQELQNDNLKFGISIEKRPSGLIWNSKNTALVVTGRDSTYAVIANKWLERLADGGAKEHIYAPFSTAFYQDELILNGEIRLRNNIHSALSQLDVWGVGSLAFTQKKITTIVALEYVRNIALNEQTDPQEFYAFLAGAIKYNPFKRVLVLIGANGEEAYSETKSGADALGLHQFTEDTWNLMRKTNPDARLPDFRSGAGNHVISSRATALLYDYNLAELVKAFGGKILKDKNLIPYIAAAHNCGVKRVIRALKKPGHDWRRALRKLGKTDETIIFLEKMDYLMDGNN